MARAKEEAGSRPDVADVRSSGVGATAPGGHPSLMYAPFPTLTAADQAEQFVAERIAEGSDYLKIFSGITATRAIERIWRGGKACDRHAFVASAAEAEQLDAFDAQLAKVVAAVRERRFS